MSIIIAVATLIVAVAHLIIAIKRAQKALT